MRRLTLTVVGVGAAVALLGACGGGGGNKKASSTATTVSSTQAAPSGGGGGDFCAKVAAYSQKYSAALQKDFQAAFTNPSDATRAALKSDLQATRDAIKNAASSAPGQIKADVDTVFRVLDQQFSALEKANFDYTKLAQTDPSVARGLQDPNFVAAAQRLTAYGANVCHVAPPTTG